MYRYHLTTLLSSACTKVFLLCSECIGWYPVFLGTLQGVLTHVVHWIWSVASSEHVGSVADYCQHADWSITVCHVHWAHLNTHPLCNLCQQTVQ